MSHLTVDFQRVLGPVKPLHGVNNGPKSFTLFHDHSDYYRRAGFPTCRLHDTEYPFGGYHYVDIHCVFPNWDADPDDPASYDFIPTDAYIQSILDTGCGVFYRLGASIEHGPKKYFIHPPADNLKWAKICAGIVRHYNHGWADGFHHGIRYWEIWNEPEGGAMWTGTRAQYFNLYATASKYLKAQFPEIMVGGYASCGFYAVTRPDADAFFQSFVPYAEQFLDFISAEQAPLDFFSWHLYSDNVQEFAAHADYVDALLARHGYAGAESICDEWNIEIATQRRITLEAAAFCAAVLCTFQAHRVDGANYYDGQILTQCCGLFDYYTHTACKPYYAFVAFQELYRLGRAVFSSTDAEGLYCCAATDGTRGALLLSNYSDRPISFTADLRGLSRRLEPMLLDETHDLEPVDRSVLGTGDACTIGAHAVLLLR